MITQPSRKIHFDILRIISCLLVIATHTIIYRYHTLPAAGNLRPLYIGVTFLIKTGVPTMFMISGALLIPKEESFSILIKKRILRYIAVLFVFSLISYLYSVFKTSGSLNWWIFFTNLYSYEQVYSYWFLYQYLAYLISLPFLRKMAKSMSLYDFRYLFIIWLILKNADFISYGIFRTPIPYSASFTLFIMEHQVFFPLAGYYLECRLEQKYFTQKQFPWFAFAAALVAIIITVLVQNHYWNTTQNPDQEAFLDTLVFIPAIVNFYLIKRLSQHACFPDRFVPVLSRVSSCTFGIYLLHHIYMEETLLIGEHLRDHIGVAAGTFAWVLLIFLIGTVVASLLKLLPPFKKLI